MSQTIINDVPPYTQAHATGGQNVFDTNWTANAESDVVVYLTPVGSDPNDADDMLDYPSEYSVTFIGALEQVRVTLVTPATLNDIVTITRMTPADRENLYSNTNFTPSMLNNDFGILTLVDQQAQLVNQKVAPRYNYSADITEVVDTILPVLQANQVWIKDANNEGFIGLTIEGGEVGSGTVNLGSQNEIAYYAANGNEVSGLSTSPNSVMVTNVAGAPSLQSELPSGIQAENMNLITPSITGGVMEFPVINDATLTTPELGTPVSGVLTNCTGLPSGTGILCTNTNNSASAGQLGEIISSVILSASAVSLTNQASADITSISLTAGDWDVWGNIFFISSNNSALSAVGGAAWISSSSATLPDRAFLNRSYMGAATATSSGNGLGINAPGFRISLSSLTTIYLSGNAAFNAPNTVSACGGIYARRRR